MLKDAQLYARVTGQTEVNFTYSPIRVRKHKPKREINSDKRNCEIIALDEDEFRYISNSNSDNDICDDIF